MFKKAEKFSKFAKDILQPIYFAVWLLLVLASIIPQAYPILFNPLVVEGAKYVTLVLISVFGSYLLLKRSEKRSGKVRDTLSETEKRIVEIQTKTGEISDKIQTLRGEITNLKIDQDGKHQDLDKKVSQLFNEVSKANTLTLTNNKRLEQFFFTKCPLCNTRIDLDYPNTVISGIHEVDGRASDSTSRGTKELDLQCPQCRRKYHIDIPHSELIKF